MGWIINIQVQFQVHCLLRGSGVWDTAPPSHAMCLQGTTSGQRSQILFLSVFSKFMNLQFSLSSSLVHSQGWINYVRGLVWNSQWCVVACSKSSDLFFHSVFKSTVPEKCIFCYPKLSPLLVVGVRGTQWALGSVWPGCASLLISFLGGHGQIFCHHHL